MADELSSADPCMWPVTDGVTGKKRPCGWRESVNLRPHIKSHKIKNKSVTVDQYRGRFPKANLGPAWVPPPDHLAKFKAANPSKKPKDAIESTVQLDKPAPSGSIYGANEEQIQLRFEELHRMVSNDPAAKHFCMQAAREEDRNVQLNKQLDLEMQKTNPDMVQLKLLRQACADSMKELKELFHHLNLTIKERRKDNQLGGNDTVSQIMSNYANTRRKWSPARNAMFDKLIEDWNARTGERIQRRVIDEAPKTLGAVKEGHSELVTDDDFNTAISAIGEPVRKLQ